MRVVVVDDNPHVSWAGRTYPVNATFHRFLAAVLDVDGVDAVVHAVPLRPASGPPSTLPLDPRLEVVATAPFEGIAGFLRHAGSVSRRNHGVLRAAIRGADLVWIKVPASNAALAAWLAWRAGVPRFVYVAGRASDVVAGQRRGRLGGAAAGLVAAAYDAIGRLVAIGGDRVVVGREIITSLVEPDELRTPPASWPRAPGTVRIAWAGRLAPGKGVETLLDAVATLPAGATVELLGDGPARAALEARAAALGLGDRATFVGYVADRRAFLDRLASADLFAFPSPAEGFPKAVLDAMAVGLPVISTGAGQLTRLVRAGAAHRVAADDPAALAAAISGLVDDPDRSRALAARGAAFAREHTRPAEAARLVARWQEGSRPAGP